MRPREEKGREIWLMIDCEILLNSNFSCFIVSTFELINTLGKGMNPFIVQAMGWMVILLFIYKDGFGIK